MGTKPVTQRLRFLEAETTTNDNREDSMSFKQNCGMVLAMCLVAALAPADSLELKNGSLIRGKFMGGSDNSINFQVGSSMQSYNIGAVLFPRFGSEGQEASTSLPSEGHYAASALTNDAEDSSSIIIP